MSENLDVQARQKAGKWGHEKGWRWVSRERMGAMCARHPHEIVTKIFFGRRVVAVEDRACKLRAMVRKARKGAPGQERGEVILPREGPELKP